LSKTREKPAVGPWTICDAMHKAAFRMNDGVVNLAKRQSR